MPFEERHSLQCLVSTSDFPKPIIIERKNAQFVIFEGCDTEPSHTFDCVDAILAHLHSLGVVRKQDYWGCPVEEVTRMDLICLITIENHKDE